MSADSISRQPAGTPTGGRFATTARTEPEVALVGPPHWVIIEREHAGPLAVGPFDSEAAAVESMEDGIQLQGLCEDDCLDSYVGSGELAGDVEQVSVAVDLTDDEDAPFSILAETRRPSMDDLKAEWQESFDALRAAGMGHDADDPIAKRYRTSSDTLNHALRKTDFQVATGNRPKGTAIPIPDAPTPVQALTALALKLNIDPSDLDDAVRGVTDTMASTMVNGDPDAVPIEDSQDEHYGAMDVHASSINNGGLQSQVPFLVEEIGPERTEEIMRQCAEYTARSRALVRPLKKGR